MLSKARDKLRELSWPFAALMQIPRHVDNHDAPRSDFKPAQARVHAYLADVTLRFESAQSRIRTIAKAAGLSDTRPVKRSASLSDAGCCRIAGPRRGMGAGRTLTSFGRPIGAPERG